MLQVTRNCPRSAPSWRLVSSSTFSISASTQAALTGICQRDAAGSALQAGVRPATAPARPHSASPWRATCPLSAVALKLPLCATSTNTCMAVKRSMICSIFETVMAELSGLSARILKLKFNPTLMRRPLSVQPLPGVHHDPHYRYRHRWPSPLPHCLGQPTLSSRSPSRSTTRMPTASTSIPRWFMARKMPSSSTPVSPVPTPCASLPMCSSGKQLTTIYVSQADPDYYFGVEALKEVFPQADV